MPESVPSSSNFRRRRVSPGCNLPSLSTEPVVVMTNADSDQTIVEAVCCGPARLGGALRETLPSSRYTHLKPFSFSIETVRNCSVCSAQNRSPNTVMLIGRPSAYQMLRLGTTTHSPEKFGCACACRLSVAVTTTTNIGVAIPIHRPPACQTCHRLTWPDGARSD